MLLEGILKKIFGDPNEKEIKNIREIVDKINSLEGEMQSLSSANLAAKTAEFKVRLQKGETLMIFCRRPLPLYVRHLSALQACVILMCR